MNKYSELMFQAKNIESRLRHWRRYFHENPELGLYVPRTASYIRKILEELKIHILTGTPGHSVVAFIPGLSDKAPLALRADMDALPIPEKNNLSYNSAIDNRMHACGHDGHMAMLLGAAEIICQNKAERDIYLVFQPGEEGPGGAKPIMDSGVLKGIREIYGIHLDPTLPVGTVGINHDRAMASNDDFYITIKGKGGHAGLPHQAVDPIAIAAQIINSFQFIVSRLIDPVDPSVITLGTIGGGFMPNAIAEEVKLSGTIRTFSEQVRNQIQREIATTVDMFCKRYGSDFSLEIVKGYPPVINHGELSSSLMEKFRDIGDLNVKQLDSPRMTAEDFSYYLSEIPGVFYWLGCSSDATTSYPLHHSCFNMDESVLSLGAFLHAVTALT